MKFVSYFRALDKNEYNHITATYFLLAERRLKVSRQEKSQSDGTNKTTTNNGRASPKKTLVDVVDGPLDISSNNLLAPPPTGFYSNSKTAPDGVTTVSITSQILITRFLECSRKMFLLDKKNNNKTSFLSSLD